MGLCEPPENYEEIEQRPRAIDKDLTGRQETRLREHLYSGAVQVRWMRVFCRHRRHGKIPAVRISPYPAPACDV